MSLAIMDHVALDHNYAKHFGQHTNTPKCPTRYLFMNRPQRRGEVDAASADLEVIDVGDSSSVVALPVSKGMCSDLVSSDCDSILWEDQLNTSSWSDGQISFFEDILAILKTYQLAIGTSNKNVAVNHHVALSKASLRLLRLLCSVTYDKDLFLWIHTLIKSSPDYSVVWLEILSYFNGKYRGLFEKMQVISHIGSLPIKLLSERPKLGPLQYMNNIVIVALPPKPKWFSESRYKTFVWTLSRICQVKSVKPNHRSSHSSTELSLRRWLRNITAETRNVVKKIRQTAPSSASDVGDSASKTGSSVTHCSKYKIVLLAWGATAMLACQLAASYEVEENENPLSGVICLCPTVCSYAHGLRGNCNDPLPFAKLRVPIMFVTGQRATSSNVDDLEDLRDRLPTETKSKMIVVGGADDRLAVCSTKRISLGLTQADIDAAVIEEMYHFLSFVSTGVSSDGIKSDVAEVPHPPRSDGNKRSSQSAGRSGANRGGKVARMVSSLPGSHLLSSISSPTPHHRGHLPASSLILDQSLTSATSHAQGGSTSDQLEVMCHDYAASSHPINTIVGQPQAPISLYSSMASEQSLRFMLSAGTVVAGETVKRVGPNSSGAVAVTVTQRCPAPLVYRKKVAPAAAGVTFSAVVDPSRHYTQQQHPTTSTVSIINVNSSSNVFVVSSHVKD